MCGGGTNHCRHRQKDAGLIRLRRPSAACGGSRKRLPENLMGFSGSLFVCRNCGTVFSKQVLKRHFPGTAGAVSKRLPEHLMRRPQIGHWCLAEAAESRISGSLYAAPQRPETDAETAQILLKSDFWSVHWRSRRDAETAQILLKPDGLPVLPQKTLPAEQRLPENSEGFFQAACFSAHRFRCGRPPSGGSSFRSAQGRRSRAAGSWSGRCRGVWRLRSRCRRAGSCRNRTSIWSAARC